MLLPSLSEGAGGGAAEVLSPTVSGEERRVIFQLSKHVDI